MSGSPTARPVARAVRTAALLIGVLALVAGSVIYALQRQTDTEETAPASASREPSQSVVARAAPSVRPSAKPSDKAPEALTEKVRKLVEAPLIERKPEQPKQDDQKQDGSQEQSGGPAYQPGKEVWQAAQPAHAENSGNPLAGRRWGVYQGPREDTWGAYQAASGKNRELLGKIALRPKATWLGDWSASPQRIGPEMDKYIANMSGGDRETLVQMSIFRMEPWEHDACGSGPGPRQRSAYRTWISNAARAIGDQHTAIILQPDLPFWFCTDRKAVSELMKFSVDTFESLPNTSVYLDAGAADWSSTPQSVKPNPGQAADLLMANGIGKARGFALNATHYMGTAESVAWGTRIVQILADRGVPGVHFVTDTAQNGNPMRWEQVQKVDSPVNDNARVCQSTSDRKGCVTLGIPPTSRVGDERWNLPAEQRAQAKEHVDGFLWYSRSWMYRQAHWRGPQRGLDMARSTSWPGPPAS